VNLLEFPFLLLKSKISALAKRQVIGLKMSPHVMSHEPAAVKRVRELESHYLCTRYHRVTQSLQVAAAFFTYQLR
jgi:hypothetical protein